MSSKHQNNFSDEKLNLLTGRSSIIDAFSNFGRIDRLGETELAKLCIVENQRRQEGYGDSAKGRGLALKQVLTSAIELLRPDHHPPNWEWAKECMAFLDIGQGTSANDRDNTEENWQGYFALKFKTRGTRAAVAADMLKIAEKTFFNRLNPFASIVGNILYQWEQQCKKLLPPPDIIHVERQADVDLKQWLMNWNRNEHLAITIRGPRGTGKTTLLQQSGIGSASRAGIKIVSIDLNEFGLHSLANSTESYDNFLRELGRLIARKIEINLNIDDIWEDSRFGEGTATTKLTWLMEDHILPAIQNQAMILALDEADLLMTYSPYYEDFFSMLRGWYNKGSNPNLPLWKKFGLILAISTEPQLLIENPLKSPFNVGYRIYLEDFDKDCVLQLNNKYVQRYGRAPTTEAEIEQMMDLLGGHPALTRHVLDILVNNETERWTNIAIRVDDVNNSLFSRHLHEVFSPLREFPALKKVYKQILALNKPRGLVDTILGYLGLSQRSRTLDDKTLFRLLRAGLISRSGDTYECRNKLYADYFRNTF